MQNRQKERQGGLASIEAAAVSGFAFAVLAIASTSILTLKPEASNAAEIQAFYADAGERRLDYIALTMVSFSAIAFLWFVAVVRRRVGDREDRFFSTVFLGSAFTYVGLALVGAAIIVGPSVAIDFVSGVAPTQEVYSLTIGAGYAILLGVVPRISAVFVFTTSTLMLRAGVVYRWVSFLGYAIAVVMLVVPVLSSPSGVGLPIWVAIASIVLFVRKEKIATEIAQSAPAEGGQPRGRAT